MTDTLPPVVNVEHGRRDGDDYAEATFGNGVRLRYRRTDEDRVVEETFAPDDPHSVWESSDVTGHHDEDEIPDVGEYLTVSLDVYFDHETVESLERDWSTLYDAFVVGS